MPRTTTESWLEELKFQSGKRLSDPYDQGRSPETDWNPRQDMLSLENLLKNYRTTEFGSSSRVATRAPGPSDFVSLLLSVPTL